MAKNKVLPKKIGGVKIPKRLRKLGDEALSNPMMREISSGGPGRVDRLGTTA